ncbi:hypothetical protein A2U01_0098271, partial [Trifolium medium]|nr:hypothetical protein [Trifolium medium]
MLGTPIHDRLDVPLQLVERRQGQGQPSRLAGDGHVVAAGLGSKPKYRDHSLMLLDDCKSVLADKT